MGDDLHRAMKLAKWIQANTSPKEPWVSLSLSLRNAKVRAAAALLAWIDEPEPLPILRREASTGRIAHRDPTLPDLPWVEADDLLSEEDVADWDVLMREGEVAVDASGVNDADFATWKEIGTAPSAHRLLATVYEKELARRGKTQL